MIGETFPRLYKFSRPITRGENLSILSLHLAGFCLKVCLRKLKEKNCGPELFGINAVIILPFSCSLIVQYRKKWLMQAVHFYSAVLTVNASRLLFTLHNKQNNSFVTETLLRQTSTINAPSSPVISSYSHFSKIITWWFVKVLIGFIASWDFGKKIIVRWGILLAGFTADVFD